jgi:hypothetical protein
MAHVLTFGHVPGSIRLRTIVADHGTFLLYAIQHPPRLWVVWVGRRASGSVPLGDGVFTGWLWVLYPLLRRTWASAPCCWCSGVSVGRRTSGVWRSSKVTISIREGLLFPTFCVLRVRMVNSVSGGSNVGVCGYASAFIVGVKEHPCPRRRTSTVGATPMSPKTPDTTTIIGFVRRCRRRRVHSGTPPHTRHSPPPGRDRDGVPSRTWQSSGPHLRKRGPRRFLPRPDLCRQVIVHPRHRRDRLI